MRRLVAVVLAVVTMAGCATTGETHAARADGPGASAGASPGADVSEEVFRGALMHARSQATTAVVSFVATNAGPELISASGRVDFGTDPISFSLTTYQGQETVSLISVAGVAYVRDPQQGPMFVRFELEDPENPFGALGGQIDPEVAYAELAEGVVSIVAEDLEVGGEALRVYAVTVDPALLTAPPDTFDGGELPETVEYQWSFDDRGQLRKVEADLGPGVAGYRYSFANWGEVDGISPPPRELVVRAPGSTGAQA